MRTMLVAGNWKMFTLAATATGLAKTLVAELGSESRVQIAVFPPFPYLALVREALAGSRIQLGAQNLYHEKDGAFTGEVSPLMLLDVGCTWVILGHSERRHKLGESDDLINRKVQLALKSGLNVILCVGETLQQREAGQTEEVLQRQLKGSMASVEATNLPRLALAYEPVWAIGTGHNATAEQAQQAHVFLRGQISQAYSLTAAEAITICYGGSVKPDNINVLDQCPDVDGVLVGGASLNAGQFVTIARAVADYTSR